MVMFRTTPRSNRTQLGFAEEVISNFCFLTQKYNFRLVKAEPTFVRYESHNVFVNIYHGRASYELGFEVGQLIDAPGQERAFSLSDIIDLLSASEETDYILLQASTAERVKEYVSKLAAMVKKYAGAALQGDPQVFKRLSKIQLEKSNKLLKEWNLSEIREQAEKAWHEKDYALLAKLYDSIRGELSPAEAKKLEYAKRQSK